jgi:hypothetical protein
LGRAYRQLNDPDGRKRAFARAAEAAASTEGAAEQFWAYATLAEQQAWAGDAAAARAATAAADGHLVAAEREEPSDPVDPNDPEPADEPDVPLLDRWRREWPATLAARLADAGEAGEAVAMARQMTDPHARDALLSRLSVERAERGDYAGARVLAGGLPRRARGSVYHARARADAAAGRLTDAARWIERLPSRQERAKAYMGVAHALLSRQAGVKQEAAPAGPTTTAARP